MSCFTHREQLIWVEVVRVALRGEGRGMSVTRSCIASQKQELELGRHDGGQEGMTGGQEVAGGGRRRWVGTLWDGDTGDCGGREGDSRRRDCHSAAPPSPCSRCFNMDGEGMSVE